MDDELWYHNLIDHKLQESMRGVTFNIELRMLYETLVASSLWGLLRMGIYDLGNGDMPPFSGVLVGDIPYVPFPRDASRRFATFLYSLYLPTPPYASLYFPTYPYISLYLTTPFPILTYSSRCFATFPMF
jgi:hypothetical protein